VLKEIRWKRVLLAAVLSEAGVIAALLAVITIYGRLFAPALTDAQSRELGERVGYYVAPTAGAITTFLLVLWVARQLDSAHVANGVMVGAVSVILTSGFLFMAKPEDRFMYIVAFGLRIAAGYAGGRVAERRFNLRPGRRAEGLAL